METKFSLLCSQQPTIPCVRTIWSTLSHPNTPRSILILAAPYEFNIQSVTGAMQGTTTNTENKGNKKISMTFNHLIQQ